MTYLSYVVKVCLCRRTLHLSIRLQIFLLYRKSLSSHVVRHLFSKRRFEYCNALTVLSFYYTLIYGIRGILPRVIKGISKWNYVKNCQHRTIWSQNAGWDRFSPPQQELWACKKQFYLKAVCLFFKGTRVEILTFDTNIIFRYWIRLTLTEKVNKKKKKIIYPKCFNDGCFEVLVKNTIFTSLFRVSNKSLGLCRRNQQNFSHALISDSVLDGLKSQHGQKMYARVKLNLNFFPVWMSEIWNVTRLSWKTKQNKT